MTSNLKWDHNQAMSAKSSVDSANSSISGDSVNSPSGCGWSAADASAVVSKPSGSVVGIEIEHPVAVNQFIECRLDYDVG